MKRTLLTLTWEGYCRLWNVTMLVFANTSTCDLSKGDGRATLQYMIRYKNRVHLWAYQKRQSSGAFSKHWNCKSITHLATKCVVVLFVMKGRPRTWLSRVAFSHAVRYRVPAWRFYRREKQTEAHKSETNFVHSSKKNGKARHGLTGSTKGGPRECC